MNATRILLLLHAALLLMTGAAADAPTLKVRVESDVESIEIRPGTRETVDLTVTVEFVDFSCTDGTKVGVDLVPPSAPPDWFGADPHPDADTYAQPKQTKPATLTIVVDADAPGGAEGVYRLQPVLHLPAPQSCGGVEPTPDAPEFSIRVTTPPPPKAEATSGDPGDGNDLPVPSWLSMAALGLCGLWLWRRRQ